jgi:hypothetical protein
VPKGPPPSWSRRDCSMDHLVAAAIAQGPGEVLRYTGIETAERAHEIRRGIYRCAKHRRVSASAGPSGRTVGEGEMGVHRARGGYELWFTVNTKRSARKAHLARYGPDRSAWPYDPKRGATADERESWANRDETGRAVHHDDD